MDYYWCMDESRFKVTWGWRSVFILLGNETLRRRFDLCSSGQRASGGIMQCKA